MKPHKIIFVVTEDWYFVSHRLNLAIAAQEAGYEVIVASRMASHLKMIETSGIRAVPLRFMKRSSLNIFTEIIAIFELIMLFRKEKPAILHLVALKPVIYGSLASWISRTPCRVNALGGLGFVFSSNRFVARLLRPILKVIFRFVFNMSNTRLILQNKEDIKFITEKSGVQIQKVRLIQSSGVDLNKYKKTVLPKGTPIVMLASRMLWDKGIDTFVKAADRLKKQGIIARFVLVGAPDKQNLTSVSEQQLQQWHNAGTIEWWGYQENMFEVLSQASIVCLPTVYGEGVPKVLIEAMGCARPIITTDMPGCRELIKGERNGILINPRDATDLANAISKLLADPLICQKMGYEGRRIAETTYSLPTVISKTLNVYKELLK